MSGLKPYSLEGWEAVKLLTSWFQRIDKLSHQDIGMKVGRNRATVSSDLSRPPSNSQTERRLFELYGKWIADRTKQSLKCPRYLRSLFEEVLTEEALKAIYPEERFKGRTGDSREREENRFEVVTDSVTLERSSGYGVDNHPIRYDPDGLPRLYGLSILVRPSNESVEVIQADGSEVLEYGVSVSLLNIVPEYVQAGVHHPLFKLRQRGTGRNIIDVEGIVLCQDDRIVLSGRDDGQKRNMLASIYFRKDAAINYRNKGNGRASESLYGVMLGVSNSKNHFCSLFTLFALPGGLLQGSDLQNEAAMEAFQRRYDAGRNATGVFRERDLAGVLAALGIDDAKREVAAMLKKSRSSRIFSVAV
ncbi:MAG TPA: hypothetical protein VE986_09550 [Hyphomicrobiales bacterium]|nr:hypothetical protein [Hyphomicrobiales bacterium]